MSKQSSFLAMNGGVPVRTRKWPAWPQYGPSAVSLLQDVLDGSRWAISGLWTGTKPLDQVFSEQFSQYLGVKYCVPTDHCSSALFLAMRALGVGSGDEVIVPGLTWVACATSVLRTGATPVLVDIESDTLCLAPAAVESAINSRTAAIMVVHLYSAMAQMDELINLSQKHCIPIIEDCAQAHGARWRGRTAGSLTEVGAFSMQQGKVLTCGEGGAVVTSDEKLYSLLEQMRNDGRRYAGKEPEVGHMHLEEVGEVIGSNFALSEFQLAILLDGLSRLEGQLLTRSSNAKYLDHKLEELGGVSVIKPHTANDLRSYYHYVARFEPSEFAGKDVMSICKALEAELQCWVHPTYRPLNDHPLYRPHLDPTLSVDSETRGKLDPSRYSLPEATKQHERSILFHHSILLGEQGDMDDIVTAFEKVKKMSHTIPDR